MSMYVAIKDGMGEITESGGVYSTTGMTEADLLFTQSHLIGTAGIVGAGDFAVSENSPADKSVDVATGEAYVENGSYSRSSSKAKFWQVTNDATVNVSISDNVSGNPRIDIICIKVDTVTTPNGDASNIATVVVVEGTPASSPSVPSTPANHYKLAEVAVANGFTSIVDADITDTRAVVGLAGSTFTGEPQFNAGYSSTGQETAGVRRVATQTIATGAFTAISFDTEDWDQGSLFAPTSTTLNLPAGTYAIHGRIQWAGSGVGERILRYYVNGGGTSYGYSRIAPTAFGPYQVSSTIIKQDSAFTLQMYGYQSSGGNLTATAELQVARLF